MAVRIRAVLVTGLAVLATACVAGTSEETGGLVALDAGVDSTVGLAETTGSEALDGQRRAPEAACVDAVTVCGSATVWLCGATLANRFHAAASGPAGMVYATGAMKTKYVRRGFGSPDPGFGTALLTAFKSSANGLQGAWSRGLGGAVYNELFAVAVRTNGQVVLGGTQGSGPALTNAQLGWIVTTDRDGQPLWQRQIKPESGTRLMLTAILLDGGGGSIAAVGDASTSDNHLQTSRGQFVRLDADGTLQKSSLLPLPALSAVGIVRAKGDHIVVLAPALGTDDSGSKKSQFWLAELDAQLAIVWQATPIQAPIVHPRALTRTANDDLLVGGRIMTGDEKTSCGWMVARLDSAGKTAWVKCIVALESGSGWLWKLVAEPNNTFLALGERYPGQPESWSRPYAGRFDGDGTILAKLASPAPHRGMYQDVVTLASGRLAFFGNLATSPLPADTGETGASMLVQTNANLELDCGDKSLATGTWPSGPGRN